MEQSQPARGQSRVLAGGAGAIVIAAYLVSFLLVNKQGLWINDNHLKFIQVQGIASSGGRDFAVPWPGARLDPDYRFNPLPEPLGKVRDGRLYITYSVFFAAITAVPYRLFGFTGLFLIPLLSFLALLPALWIIAGALPGPRLGRPLAAVIAGLATPVWFYSLTLWEHMPAVAFAFLGLALLLQHLRRPNMIKLAGSGLLTAGSIYFRADMYLWAAALMAVMVLSRDQRKALPVWAGFTLLGLLPMWGLQQLWLGQALGFHLTEHSPLASGVGPFLAGRLAMAWHLILANHETAWVSAVLAGPALLLWWWRPGLTPERHERAIMATAAFGAIMGAVILTSQYLSDRPLWRLVAINGFFSGSYALLPGLITRRDKEASDEMAILLQRLSLIFAGLYVLLSPPSSRGVHWGCRFLLPLYPLLAALAASAIAKTWEQSKRRRWLAAAAATAIGISILAQVYSIGLLHRERTFSARLHEEVKARPEPVLVTSDWFVPEILGRDFYGKMIFRLSRPGDGAALAERLEAAGIGRVLVVSALADHQPAAPGAQVIDDGLNFIRLQIGPAPISDLKR